MGCFHPGSQVVPWIQLDTLDRLPFGHKTLFTFAKTACLIQAANRRRIIGARKPFPPDPSNFPYLQRIGQADRRIARIKAGIETGGGGRDRTDDLKLAKLALSQLSYAPGLALEEMVGQGGLEPPTPRLSSVCSNQLSY